MESCMYNCSKTASGKHSTTASDVPAEKDFSGGGKESGVVGNLSSWTHRSSPQMGATAPGITNGSKPTYKDRRVLQLRADDDNDAMYRFK